MKRKSDLDPFFHRLQEFSSHFSAVLEKMANFCAHIWTDFRWLCNSDGWGHLFVCFWKKVIKTIYSASRSGSKLRLLLLFNFPLDYKAVADVYRAEQSLLESKLLVGVQLESGSKGWQYLKLDFFGNEGFRVCMHILRRKTSELKLFQYEN